MTITRVNVQTKQVETGIPYTAEEQAAIDAAIAAQAATVPAMVTRHQFKRALKAANGNAIGNLNTWIQSLPEDDDSRLYFEDSTVLKRSSSAIEAARIALSKTNAQIDAIFVSAATF